MNARSTKSQRNGEFDAEEESCEKVFWTGFGHNATGWGTHRGETDGRGPEKPCLRSKTSLKKRCQLVENQTQRAEKDPSHCRQRLRRLRPKDIGRSRSCCDKTTADTAQISSSEGPGVGTQQGRTEQKTPGPAHTEQWRKTSSSRGSKTTSALCQSKIVPPAK
jgi:hypothetical protein